jgi:hypothetical protein
MERHLSDGVVPETELVVRLEREFDDLDDAQSGLALIKSWAVQGWLHRIVDERAGHDQNVCYLAQDARRDGPVSLPDAVAMLDTAYLGHVIVLWSWALTQPNPETTESTTVHFRSLDSRDRESPFPFDIHRAHHHPGWN